MNSEKIFPSAALSIIQHDLGSNPKHHGGKPMTDRLSYDTAHSSFNDASATEDWAGSINAPRFVFFLISARLLAILN
jgi:hypothetical protein